MTSWPIMGLAFTKSVIFMKYKIVIGVPSFNEAENIGFVVKEVDKGLVKFFDPSECLIINLDSDSEDNTKESFLKTSTQTTKKYINTGKWPRGKGKNILKLFEFSQEVGAEYIATIDADVKSVNPDWVFTLLEPLIERDFDYCIPLYTRNRFEGNITNNFAYPLVYSFYGVDVRQPIGGDFGVSSRLCNFLLTRPRYPTTLQYGIDIFMTCNAIEGGFNLIEVFLGKKFHRPSFYHMVPTFQNVFESGVYVTRLHEINENKFTQGKFEEAGGQNKGGIDEVGYYPHRSEVPGILKECTKKILNFRETYEDNLGQLSKDLFEVIKSGKPVLSADLWTSVLAMFLKVCYSKNFDINNLPFLARVITPIYLLRAVSFWEEVEPLTTKEAENRVEAQAKLLRHKIR